MLYKYKMYGKNILCNNIIHYTVFLGYKLYCIKCCILIIIYTFSFKLLHISVFSILHTKIGDEICKKIVIIQY